MTDSEDTVEKFLHQALSVKEDDGGSMHRFVWDIEQDDEGESRRRIEMTYTPPHWE